MKVCAFSDGHGYLPEIEPCDIVCIAGDIIPLDIQLNSRKSKRWFNTEFADWVNKLPCDKVFVVAGNHDFYLERHSVTITLEEDPTNGKCIYLNNESAIYMDSYGNNWNIYGTPLTHKFGNWAFMLDNESLEEKYKNIPHNVDILISHDTPSYKKLGLLPPSKWSTEPIEAGNKPLTKAIEEKKPKYVFCGHLHECYDKSAVLDNTTIINVSILNNKYQLAYKPTYITIEKE